MPESIECTGGADTAFEAGAAAEFGVLPGLRAGAAAAAGGGVGISAADASSGLEEASINFGISVTSRDCRLAPVVPI